MNTFKKYWSGLEDRERLTLSVGGIVVLIILFYMSVWRPWHVAIDTMNVSVQALRSNLIWMRQQSDNWAAIGGSGQSGSKFSGADQSLLSVVEKTANRSKLTKSIQQLVPSKDGSEVRVVLDGVDFNVWVTWIDHLYKQYGVDIKQVTAERDEDVPNVAEVRVTFVR
ncbi:type II secretion system protein GspM [Arenicella xantha]|uniref:Type II secretion system protein M n=1 Tax=Arenicella xantha TaxID=644221 RepID=A0A395JH10_9GAMM|nr:type II secretion system protein M [Arenicella xantha]RBP49250.1 type II secretory pathway component PulM [Arenicella xantha]